MRRRGGCVEKDGFDVDFCTALAHGGVVLCCRSKRPGGLPWLQPFGWVKRSIGHDNRHGFTAKFGQPPTNGKTEAIGPWIFDVPHSVSGGAQCGQDSVPSELSSLIIRISWAMPALRTTSRDFVWSRRYGFPRYAPGLRWRACREHRLPAIPQVSELRSASSYPPSGPFKTERRQSVPSANFHKCCRTPHPEKDCFSSCAA
jgi:hypothetical protein